MVKNYGKWAFHSHPKPGVLYHRAESGDEIWTVKAGTARQMDHYTVVNWPTSLTSMPMALCVSPRVRTSNTW